MWTGWKGPYMLCVWLLVFLTAVHANTEIINFHTRRGLEDPRAARVFYSHDQLDVIIGPNDPLRLNTTSAEEVQWRIGLLLDGPAAASSKASWTARISWPATMPSDFDIRVVPWKPTDHKTSLSSTHDRLLTITRRYTGVSFPSPKGSILSAGPGDQHTHAAEELTGVTFDLIVEPLTFGVIPFTAWPTILNVVLMACAGYLFATKIVLPRWIDPLLVKREEKME